MGISIDRARRLSARRGPAHGISVEGADAPVRDGDEELVRRIERRDAAALAAAYDRHIGDAWRVACLTTVDGHAAERAVEAAFRDLWKRPRRAGLTLRARLLAGVAAAADVERAAA